MVLFFAGQLALVRAGAAEAKTTSDGGGPGSDAATDGASAPADGAKRSDSVTAAAGDGSGSTKDLAAHYTTRLRFPANDPKGAYFLSAPIAHVDHDPTTTKLRTECTNYAGRPFPWCYDGHEGTDYLLRFAFATMAENVEVVAAADGVVTRVRDGHFDRCKAVNGKPDCGGRPLVANIVELRHADGLHTLYVHLMKNSIKVAVGQRVRCGDLLGYVGSSGYSITPHLHFEVHGSKSEVIDPYAGKHSQPTSLWVQQKGPHGMPSPRCAGVPAPGPDAGPADGGEGTEPEESGCNLGSGAGSTPASLLLLLLLLAIRREAAS